jgi:hypothetical protein
MTLRRCGVAERSNLPASDLVGQHEGVSAGQVDVVQPEWLQSGQILRAHVEALRTELVQRGIHLGGIHVERVPRHYGLHHQAPIGLSSTERKHDPQNLRLA